MKPRSFAFAGMKVGGDHSVISLTLLFKYLWWCHQTFLSILCGLRNVTEVIQAWAVVAISDVYDMLSGSCLQLQGLEKVYILNNSNSKNGRKRITLEGYSQMFKNLKKLMVQSSTQMKTKF